MVTLVGVGDIGEVRGKGTGHGRGGSYFPGA